MTEEEALMAPGTVGLLWDETPELTVAHVRPFVWAILMYRGACRPSEVEAAIAQVCSVEELKTELYDDGDEADTRAACSRLAKFHACKMASSPALRRKLPPS